MEFTDAGMALVDPGFALFAIALDARTPTQIPARTYFEDRVIAGAESKRESVIVRVMRWWWHDGGIEDGDDSSGGEFTEAGERGGEEVEV